MSSSKLRAKLGLKPLDVGGASTGDGPKTIEEQEVFVKTENISEKREAEKIRERLELAREKRMIKEKLRHVKGLAADSDEEDATAWIVKSRELEKKRAAEKAKALEEMDSDLQRELEEREMVRRQNLYKTRDLSGLTVGHSQQTFQEGSQVVLVLDDKDVLDEETDDVLINVNLKDDERAKVNVENKKKKAIYNPYDDGEDGMGKNLLSKYDEEIDGAKKETFKLGDTETVRERLRMKMREQEEESNRTGVSLDGVSRSIASEYYTAEEMQKFKKPKRKIKKKVLRKRVAEDKLDDLVPTTSSADDFGSRSSRGKRHEVDEPAAEEDVKPVVKQESNSKIAAALANLDADVAMDESDDEDLSGVVIEEDDAQDELQAALEKARRLRQKKDVSSVEKVAEMMAKKREEDVDTEGANIVLNSTAEFCRNLGDIPTYGRAGNREDDDFEDGDVDMEQVAEKELAAESKLDGKATTSKGEGSRKNQWSEVDPDADQDDCNDGSSTAPKPILEEEPELNMGVAGALRLAINKGYLQKDQNASAPSRSSLQAQNYTIEEKFYDDDKGHRRGERYSGPVSSFQEKSGYKPDVKLDYVDDHGRNLNQKEAFRVLSHKFHGKGPGKNKVDKRMKKLEQESKLRQMSSIDTPLNTVKLLQEKQKEMQSAYVVISGQQ